MNKRLIILGCVVLITAIAQANSATVNKKEEANTTKPLHLVSWIKGKAKRNNKADNTAKLLYIREGGSVACFFEGSSRGLLVDKNNSYYTPEQDILILKKELQLIHLSQCAALVEFGGNQSNNKKDR